MATVNPKSVIQRKPANKLDSQSVASVLDVGGGTPGLAARISSSSRPLNVNSCPASQPRKGLRKDSPLNGSSQGLNVKLPSSAKVPAANEAVKKPPPKVVSKYGAKPNPTTSAQQTTTGEQSQFSCQSQFETKYFVNEEAGNQWDGAEPRINNGDNMNRGYSGIHDSIVGTGTAFEQNECHNGVGKYNTPQPNWLNGVQAVNGPVDMFLARESTKRTRSVPIGFDLCQSERPNPFPREKISSQQISGTGNSMICSPNCTGLHFCLHTIGTFLPLESSSLQRVAHHRQQPTVVETNEHHAEINRDSELTSEPPKLEISFQEAFSSLLKIRNVATQSEMCSLEDYKNIAAIETLLLKVFSQNSSKQKN